MLEATGQESERLYSRECQSGNATACNVLGLMFETGDRVRQDLGKAREMYREACDYELWVGCANLGRLMAVPGATESDLSTAERLFRDACAHGEALACELSGAPLELDVGSARVAGVIVDSSSGRRLPGVGVTFAASVGSSSTVSDTTGSFRMGDLPAGPAELLFDGLGIEPRRVVVELQAERTTQLRVPLSAAPIALDPIEVTVRSAALERNGFYARGSSTGGAQFDRRDIEQKAPTRTSRLFSEIPGVSATSRGAGAAIARTRRVGRSCRLLVFVDGVLMAHPFDLDQIHPNQLEALEVFTGPDTPVRFQPVSDGCGAVLIWLRS